jgi:hypothetical protein
LPQSRPPDPKNANAPLQPPAPEVSATANNTAADGSRDRGRTDSVTDAGADASSHAGSADNASGRRARDRSAKGDDHARLVTDS